MQDCGLHGDKHSGYGLLGSDTQKTMTCNWSSEGERNFNDQARSSTSTY